MPDGERVVSLCMPAQSEKVDLAKLQPTANPSVAKVRGASDEFEKTLFHDDQLDGEAIIALYFMFVNRLEISRDVWLRTCSSNNESCLQQPSLACGVLVCVALCTPFCRDPLRSDLSVPGETGPQGELKSRHELPRMRYVTPEATRTKTRKV